jgi:hypothetical protein
MNRGQKQTSLCDRITVAGTTRKATKYTGGAFDPYQKFGHDIGTSQRRNFADESRGEHCTFRFTAATDLSS